MAAINANDNLLVWGESGIDHRTIEQAQRAADLSVVGPHIALMPDAHAGFGATIGSVIPTESSIIPSAVGVDIGCGMAAARTDLSAEHLPDDLTPLLGRIERAVPAGVGRGHIRRAARSQGRCDEWFASNPARTDLSQRQIATALGQFGSLGSGNHFVEICLDESDTVWLFLHSGSRGVGHQLAEQHIAVAKQLHHLAADRAELDPDLAWFEQGTTEFDAYIADMTWAQSYAAGNRAAMLAALEEEFFDFVGAGTSVQTINCHHNFAARERHGDTELWITRKGAIRADRGDLGLIPGSMGDRSFVVRGLGNPLSWNSCSHGAGRRLSRSAAKKAFTPAELAVQMGDRTWLADHAAALIDEIPAAYKPIDEVMAAQTDLVEVVHALRQVLNYKGC